jgi:cation-transporting ATPase 13A2
MEGTAIFLISTYQYVIMAFVFSKGPPYRMGISDNFFFVASLLSLTAVNMWLTISPFDYIVELLSVSIDFKKKLIY